MAIAIAANWYDAQHPDQTANQPRKPVRTTPLPWQGESKASPAYLIDATRLRSGLRASKPGQFCDAFGNPGAVGQAPATLN